MKAIRHGDLALVQIDKLPEGLTPATTHTLMQGANGNNHDVNQNGTVYLKDADRFVFGYLVAGEGCKLLHPDHGAGTGPIKTANVPAGTYELRRQFEYKHEEMTQVVD